ncbi:MAG: hypothetical protein QX196_16015 [Methylococcaceae bacterium]
MPARNAATIAGVGLYRKNSPSRLVEGQRLGKKPAAFHLERADGINMRLAHEPVFRRTNYPSSRFREKNGLAVVTASHNVLWCIRSVKAMF